MYSQPIKFLKHLLSKNTALGRTVRTLLQAVVGVTGFFLTITALPGLLTFVSQSSANAVAVISSYVAIATAIWNGTEKLLLWLNTWTEGQ